MAEWTRITNLNEGQQVTFFVQSKQVYETLFPWTYREPWGNFETYIRDTEERRRIEHPVDPEDHYYVGIAGGKAWGMMFFTTYPGELGFVAYMGVPEQVGEEVLSQHERKLLVDDMPNVITAAMNTAKCAGYLFELEKVAPEDLGRTRARTLSLQDIEVRNRILITNAFQRKGARKLGWITYRQPKLEWDREDQEVAMHLMYAPTSRFVPVQSHLDRKEVTRYMEFVYLRYYMDGFEASEANDPGGIERWRDYLTKLTNFSLRGVPKRVALQSIDLSSPKSSVFISYSQRDLRRAQLIQEYFESMGIPVFFWERGKRFRTGEPVWEVIEGWMNSCDFLIFLLTRNTYDCERNTFVSKGQKEEIEFAERNRPRLGQIKPLFSPPVSPANLQEWFDQQLIGTPFTNTTFYQAVEDLTTQILGKS